MAPGKKAKTASSSSLKAGLAMSPRQELKASSAASPNKGSPSLKRELASKMAEMQPAEKQHKLAARKVEAAPAPASAPTPPSTAPPSKGSESEVEVVGLQAASPVKRAFKGAPAGSPTKSPSLKKELASKMAELQPDAPAAPLKKKASLGGKKAELAPAPAAPVVVSEPPPAPAPAPSPSPTLTSRATATAAVGQAPALSPTSLKSASASPKFPRKEPVDGGMSFKSLKCRFEKMAPEEDQVMFPVFADAEAAEGVLCPEGHTMLILPAAANSEVTRVCQICGQTVDECANYHGCGLCDYDLCTDCGSEAFALQSKLGVSSLAKSMKSIKLRETQDDLYKAVMASGKLEARALEKKKAAAKAKAAMHTGVKAASCPKGHPLYPFPAPANEEVVHSCQSCGLSAEPCTSLRGCGFCDFDLCEACYQEATFGPKRSLACPAKHALTSVQVEVSDKVNHVCNGCGTTAELGDRVHVCLKCDFDMCEECASKEPIATPSSGLLTSSNKKATAKKPASRGQKLCCPNKHVLAAIPAPANSEVTRVCNSCGDKVEECSTVMSCSKCDYDFCSKCASQALSGLSKDPSCPAGHVLTMLVVEGMRVCNSCSTSFDEGERVHSCARCDYDLCIECARKADALASTLQLSSGDLAALTEARNQLVKSKKKVCRKEVSHAPAGPFAVTCHQGHKVTAFPAPAPSEGERVCNLCSAEIAEGESLHTCGACDYDICDTCALKESHKPPAPVVVKELEKPTAAEDGASKKNKQKESSELDSDEEEDEEVDDESEEEETGDSLDLEDSYDDEEESEEAAAADEDASVESAPAKRSKASKTVSKKAQKKAKRAGERLTYDLKHMAAYDLAPQSATVIEAEFLAYSRSSAQKLVNTLFKLGKKGGGEDGMAANVRMPRQKLTRWETFMEERGMTKRKRSVFDQHLKPFRRMKAEKKLQKLKQKLREVRDELEVTTGKLTKETKKRKKAAGKSENNVTKKNKASKKQTQKKEARRGRVGRSLTQSC